MIDMSVCVVTVILTASQQQLSPSENKFPILSKEDKKMASEELQKALKFMNFQNMPSMKELRNRYFELVLQMHPDKFPKEQEKQKTEEFKKLGNALKVIGDIIEQNRKN